MLPRFTPLEAAAASLAAAKAFQPRTPINLRQLFAGRWSELTTIVDAVNQSGLHIVIFGERGVGKTSLSNVISPTLEVMDESISGKAEPRIVEKVNTHSGDTFGRLWNRALTEVAWISEEKGIGLVPSTYPAQKTLKGVFGVSDDPSIDEVRRVLAVLKRSVFIFDEFDRASPELRTNFTDFIKALSDYAVDSTIVLVGVSDTVDHLIKDHASIVRAVIQVQLERMTQKELHEILENGEKALGMKFDTTSASLVTRMSQGLPHYTHLIGLHSVREAANRLSRTVESVDVFGSLKRAVKDAVQSTQHDYLKAIHSARRDALYAQVLLACAAASSSAKDALGYFHPVDVVSPMSVILNRSNVSIGTFQKHIVEFCELERASVLERDGAPRAYKYRFRDPLLPPYIFMTAVAAGLVSVEDLSRIAVPRA